MRWSTRELVMIGVFGALWGSVEISVGSAMHAFRVPFAGAALAAGGMMIALSGRVFVNRPGAIVFIGVVTALLKMLSVGGLVFRPMIGIMAECVAAEVMLLVIGPSRAGWALAGAAAVLWTMVHPFVTAALFAGEAVLTVWVGLIERGGRLLGVDARAAAVIVGVIVCGHLLLGGVAGLTAWSAAGTVRERLNPPGDGGR